MAPGEGAGQVDAGNDQSSQEGATASFHGSFVDLDTTDNHTIGWTFGDGTQATDTPTPTHSYTDNGSYTVTLTVTDDNGGSDTDELTVTVVNVAPTADAGDAGDDLIVDEDVVVQFTAGHSDPGRADTHRFA